MAEGQAGRYGRPTRQASLAAQRTRAAPLQVSKQELGWLVSKGISDALARERRKERAKRAKEAQARLEKSGGATELARRMAAQAASTRQRQQLLELQARYDGERDPMMKSALGQQITYERLKLAHQTGRI